jgi:hypothetical protein
MSGYAVFQAHDGWAARELCILLPNIELLVLNTYGTGIDVAQLCGDVRNIKPGMPVLHIGSSVPEGLPADVPTLSENFDADGLLLAVGALIEPGLMRQAPVVLQSRGTTRSYPNGRRREDNGSRPAVPRPAAFPTDGALRLHED